MCRRVCIVSELYCVPTAMASSSSPEPEQACGFSQRTFTLDSHEATIHFQIVDLGRQYYVWISASGPKMSNLYLAIKTPAVGGMHGVPCTIPCTVARHARSHAQIAAA